MPSGEVDMGAVFKWEAMRLKAAVYDHYHAQAGAHPKPGEVEIHAHDELYKGILSAAYECLMLS